MSGAPRLHWDESAHALTFSTTASTFAINATTGNDSKLSFSENLFENAVIKFDTSPTNRMLFAFPTESDIVMAMLSDVEIQIFNQGKTDPTVTTDTYSMWAEDASGAGTASPNFKTEDGTTITLAATSIMAGLTLSEILSISTETAPSVVSPMPLDVAQIYVDDHTGEGTASLHVLNEEGDLMKFFADSGWSDPTGSSDKSTFDTSTVTTEDLAEFVKAMYEHFKTSGFFKS